MIGKYLGVIIGLTVAMVIAVSITWALAGLPGGGRFYFYLLQTSIGGVVVYTALFMMIGMLAPKNAIVVSMFYAVIVEWTFSLIPAMIHSFAVSYHLRSLFLNGVDYMLPKGEKFTEAFGRMEIISELSAAQQWGMLGIFVAVSIIVAGLLVTNREFNMTTDSA
jgi:hypothetical protein